MLRSRSLTLVLSGAGAGEESCALNIVDDKVNKNPSASVLKATPEKCFTCTPFWVFLKSLPPVRATMQLLPLWEPPLTADCRGRADPSISSLLRSFIGPSENMSSIGPSENMSSLGCKNGRSGWTRHAFPPRGCPNINLASRGRPVHEVRNGKRISEEKDRERTTSG